MNGSSLQWLAIQLVGVDVFKFSLALHCLDFSAFRLDAIRLEPALGKTLQVMKRTMAFSILILLLSASCHGNVV